MKRLINWLNKRGWQGYLGVVLIIGAIIFGIRTAPLGISITIVTIILVSILLFTSPKEDM